MQWIHNFACWSLADSYLHKPSHAPIAWLYGDSSDQRIWCKFFPGGISLILSFWCPNVWWRLSHLKVPVRYVRKNQGCISGHRLPDLASAWMKVLWSCQLPNQLASLWRYCKEWNLVPTITRMHMLLRMIKLQNFWASALFYSFQQPFNGIQGCTCIFSYQRSIARRQAISLIISLNIYPLLSYRFKADSGLGKNLHECYVNAQDKHKRKSSWKAYSAANYWLV